MRPLGSVLIPFLWLLGACGSSSSPTPVAPPTTLPAVDGVVVLDGSIGGTFTLSSSPSRFSGGRLFGCGDAAITIPYRETAGGRAVGADYEIKLLEHTGDFARRVTGRATNVAVNPNAGGTITVTERFVCIEYTNAVPPRADVAFNLGGVVRGTVSQLRGVGPLRVVE